MPVQNSVMHFSFKADFSLVLRHCNCQLSSFQTYVYIFSLLILVVRMTKRYIESNSAMTQRGIQGCSQVLLHPHRFHVRPYTPMGPIKSHVVP